MRALTRPRGKGWTVRGGMVDADGISETEIVLLKSMGITWAVVDVAHLFTLQRLQSAGITPWIFAGPFASTPSKYAATLDRMVRRAGELNCPRIVFDPENEWPGASEGQWAAMGARLERIAKSGVQVIATTHGGLRTRFAKWVAPRIAPYAGMIAPQLYDHMRDAPLNYAAQQLPRWERSMPGIEMIPYLGCFNQGPDGAVPYQAARFDAVFAQYTALPVAAACVWPTGIRNNEIRAVRAWRCGLAIEV